MGLPSSGTLSMANIRAELGVTSQSPFSLRSASIGTYAAINQCSTSRPNNFSPFSISEWYGYSSTQACTVYISVGGPTSIDSGGDYVWRAYADRDICQLGAQPILVNTFVSVSIIIYADFNTYNASGGIGVDFSCGTNTYVGATANEGVFALQISSVSPNSNGTQTFQSDCTALGSYSC